MRDIVRKLQHTPLSHLSIKEILSYFKKTVTAVPGFSLQLCRREIRSWKTGACGNSKSSKRQDSLGLLQRLNGLYRLFKQGPVITYLYIIWKGHKPTYKGHNPTYKSYNRTYNGLFHPSYPFHFGHLQGLVLRPPFITTGKRNVHLEWTINIDVLVEVGSLYEFVVE